MSIRANACGERETEKRTNRERESERERERERRGGRKEIDGTIEENETGEEQDYKRRLYRRTLIQSLIEISISRVNAPRSAPLYFMHNSS